MKNFARMAAFAAAVTIAATPAFAQTASVNNGPVNARAQITKPLTLSKLTPTSDLDFGEVIVTGTDTVRLDPDSQTRICGAVANQTCQGAFSFAEYRVTGSNNQNSDPCPDSTWGENPGSDILLADPPNGSATGVFVETVEYETGPVDPTAKCVIGQLTPCRASFVR